MALIQSIDPLFVLSGVLVGALVGLTGVGGGSLMTPILILVFGIHPSTAVGTDLLYASATKTAGSAVHGFNRNIDWGVVGRLALGSVPATAVTIFVLYRMNVHAADTQTLITKVLGVALFFTAMSLLMRRRLTKFYASHIHRMAPELVSALTIVTGAVLGVLVSLSSIGAGAIGVTALVLLYPDMAPRRIVGSDIAHAVPLTLASGIGHSFLGTIDGHILLSLLIGSIPAIILTSMLSVRLPDKFLRVTLAMILLLVCARFWLF